MKRCLCPGFLADFEQTYSIFCLNKNLHVHVHVDVLSLVEAKKVALGTVLNTKPFLVSIFRRNIHVIVCHTHQ